MSKIQITMPSFRLSRDVDFMDADTRREAIAALVGMRAACRTKGIQCPIDHLVPDDALFDKMPPELLQNTLVMATWPGVDIRIGGPEGKVQEGIGTKGRVLIFHDRKETVLLAIAALKGAKIKIEGISVQ